MPGTVNPYAARERVPGEAPGAIRALSPHFAYAVPDVPETTDPDNTNGGYAPVLRATGEQGTLPDTIRLGVSEPPGEPHIDNDPAYWRRRTAERFQRQADEETTTSWNVQQHRPIAPPIPDQIQEKPHTRPTAVRSPLGYLFTRPWHHPRNIKDAVGESAVDHISLADHRRAYEIFGMAPTGRLGANTFRKDPTPWDQFLVAMPQETMPQEPIQRAAVQAGNRSYRLGG